MASASADVTTHPAFRNSVRSIARLYDALHDPKRHDVLTCPTDTGSGGYTHNYFRVQRSREDLVARAGRHRRVVAADLWLDGPHAGLQGGLHQHARRQRRILRPVRGQCARLVQAGAGNRSVHEPRDRQSADRPPQAGRSKCKDVFVCVQKEVDGGIIVSGAKVVATSAAMTHYNFMGQSSKTATEDLDMSLMFLVPIDAPGLKLFCRTSYEQAALRNGTPFDYPLSSRFDENDAIFVLDKVFMPWEDVFIYRDPARVLSFYPRSGFINGFQFQGCTRFAVKLDFIVGLLAKALRCTGGDEARGNQVLLGEAVAWRNLFWSLSNAMAHNPNPWKGDAVLPDLKAGQAYRVFAPDAYPRIKDIIERTVTSGLIYLPSSVKDFANPAIEPYLRQYVRGSHGIDYRERIKIMKLLWDAVGTEFGGRHELYERNYAGGWEDIRAQTLTGAERGGDMAEMEALVDQCMAEYRQNPAGPAILGRRDRTRLIKSLNRPPSFDYPSSARSAFASSKSLVSKPSVNQS